MNGTNSAPIISIVIPTRNEGPFIESCLKSVFSAEFPAGGVEVLVVDGMSKDNTRSIVGDWCKKQPRLHLIDNPFQIVPCAMNIGIRAARGAWIIRLDAHSEYPKDYFVRCLDASRRTSADNVGGIVVSVGLDEQLQGKIVRALTTHWFGVGNSTPRVGLTERWADTVPFGCYRRDVFDRIGFYDERLVRNQDYELNRRLIKAGGRIWFDPKIQIFYHNRNSLSGLFRQAFDTGKWNPWMWIIAPYSFAWRHAVPMVFVLALLIGIFIFPVNPAVSITILGLSFAAYCALALIASVSQAARYGFDIFLLLPFLFFAYHAAYGLGGIYGLLAIIFGKSPIQLTGVQSPAFSKSGETKLQR